MFKFEIFKKSKNNKARLGVIKTSYGKIQTPVFMPCATRGAVKAISPQELNNLGAEIILGNTYHLHQRPGEKLIKKFGGIQKFISWRRPILTDSGGYQVFSLGAGYTDDNTDGTLVKISQKGVEFRSHLDGSKHFFTPEKVIDIQLDLGSDIIMPLDYCPSANASRKEIAKAVSITNQWFEEAWNHFKKVTRNMRDKPALFAIIQGGAYKDLREKSFKFLSKFPVSGWAIGGVANAGESKLKQRKALEFTIPMLPEDKPRYLMGVGEPEDLMYAAGQGIDMFDCVLPTRLARHGTVWAIKANKLKIKSKKFIKLDLRKSKFRDDKKPIMTGCTCYACQNFSRAYISHLIREKEILGIRLTSLHNLHLIFTLMSQIRQEI